MSRIALVQGHPDSRHPHFAHALADAYAKGAADAGHTVQRIDVARLDFPVLRSRADWEGPVPDAIKGAQDVIADSDHIVILYPMWLGSMPALLKAFLEQVMRPGFAIDETRGPAGSRHMLAGRTARVIVTMGMPAFVYRWFFRAHSLKSLERNILKFCGIKPVRDSLVGMVDSPHPAGRRRWLRRMERLGRAAA